MKTVERDTRSTGPEGPCSQGPDAPADEPAAYRVDEVLKRGPAETTEVVYLPVPNGGEAGPFVLKRLAREAHMGSAYTALLRLERAGVRYRHLPRIYSVVEVGEETHVIMELVPGETLAALVDRVGPSPALARALMPLVCEAVSELHEGLDAPIIHRDLKPANIMVDGWGPDGGQPLSVESALVTIIDLGIARSWRAEASADTTHFGTKGYAPPEQFGFGQTDVRSDVYALGALLVFCCTGEGPSLGWTAASLDAPGIPGPLAAVAARAMSFDPADRYASAVELAAAIRAVSPERERPSNSEPSAATSSEAPSDPSQAAAPFLVQVSMALGILWNLSIICTAAILAVASYRAVIDPSELLAPVDSLLRALATFLAFDVPGMAILWLLFDKRRLRHRIPQVGYWTWRRCLLLLLKSFIASSIGMVIIVIAQMGLG